MSCFHHLFRNIDVSENLVRGRLRERKMIIRQKVAETVKLIKINNNNNNKKILDQFNRNLYCQCRNDDHINFINTANIETVYGQKYVDSCTHMTA